MSAVTDAPPAVWDYLRAVAAARQMVTPAPELLRVMVVIDGTRKAFGELTADDFQRLAAAERERATSEALARLDHVDHVLGGAR